MIDSIPDKSWRPLGVEIETNLGQFSIELYWDHAPLSCRNFAELCRRGYYNNTRFHRLVPDFLIQGGDPTGTGRGGRSIYGGDPTGTGRGGFFDDEIHRELKHTGAGIVSMANAGSNVNGSQFFITLSPAQSLDGKHTIFGRLRAGMQTLVKMSKVTIDKNNCPLDPITILRTTVINE